MPGDRAFKGLMLYVPIENEASIVINGSADSAFAGTILAPASDIQVNGSGGADGFHCQFIGYTVDISGGAAMNIQYNNSENWDAPTPPSIELKH
jgi:hypothetical protein